MYCPFCGKQLPEDSEFCQFCGKELSKKEDNSTNQNSGFVEVCLSSPEDFSQKEKWFRANTCALHPDAPKFLNQRESPKQKSEYISPQNCTRTTTTKRRIPKAAIIVPSVILFLIIIVIIAATADNGNSTISEPRSGTILSGTEDLSASEITVSAPRNHSCVVKLKTKSGVTKISFYVREGEKATVGVPAEPLYVYFATGGKWYGKTKLFGEYTKYSMDSEICDFSEGPWIYTLYSVNNGNFSETPIDESEFKE